MANSTTHVNESALSVKAGQSVTLTVTVAATAPGAGAPGGTVTFLDGKNALGKATLDSTGKASLSVSTLSVGYHTINAAYGGSANFVASSGTAATNLYVYAAAAKAATILNPKPPIKRMDRHPPRTHKATWPVRAVQVHRWTTSSVLPTFPPTVAHPGYSAPTPYSPATPLPPRRSLFDTPASRFPAVFAWRRVKTT